MIKDINNTKEFHEWIKKHLSGQIVMLKNICIELGVQEENT